MYKHCHIGNDVTDLVVDEITRLFQGHEQHPHELLSFKCAQYNEFLHHREKRRRKETLLRFGQ